MAFRKNIQKRSPVLVAVFLLIATGLIQVSMRAVTTGATALVLPPPPYIGLSVNPKIIRRLLGVRLMVADFIWIDTLMKSDIVHEKESFTSFYRAMNTIIKLDPDNLYAFYIGGLYLSVVKDDIKGATAILREGARQMETRAYSWEGAWRLPFALGYNLIFEEHSFEEGSVWVQKAAQLPAAPQHVRALGERASTEQGRLEIGARVLTDLLRNTSDRDQRAQIEKKMIEITAKQELVDLNERFQIFLTSTGASALPKKRSFPLFMRSIGHSKKDVLGRPLGINAVGKIDRVE